MDKLTRKWLKQRVRIVSREIKKTGLMNIEKLADNFKFDKRRISHPEECEPFYKLGKFCHDGDNIDVYCLLCSCPNYDNSVNERGCLTGNPCGKGYYYNRINIGMEEIWDCSDCNYPHTRKETINALSLIKEYVFNGDDLNKFLWDLFTGKLIDREQASSED